MMRQIVFSGLAGCVLLLFASCTAPRPNGVPDGAVLVGSGMGFRFTAPAHGRMFVSNRGKVVIRRELHHGERFEALGPTPVEKDDPEYDFADNRYWFERKPD